MVHHLPLRLIAVKTLPQRVPRTWNRDWSVGTEMKLDGAALVSFDVNIDLWNTVLASRLLVTGLKTNSRRGSNGLYTAHTRLRPGDQGAP